MRTKFKSIFRAGCHSFGVVCAVALVLQFGVLAGSAQTGQYLFTGSETTITLNPGTYDITAYGAQGGANTGSYGGGLGAEMEGQFSFSASTILTLLVGGSGGGGSFYYMGGPGETSSSGTAGVSGGSGGSGGGGGGGGYYGGGGGGGYSGNGQSSNYTDTGGGSYLSGGVGGVGGRSYVASGGVGGFGGGGGGGAYFGVAGINGCGGGGGGGYSGGGGGNGGSGDGGSGGGGGSIIDSSAIMDLAEVSGIASPDDSPNGEIIITAVPEPTTLALVGLSGLSLILFRRRRK